MSTSKLQRSVSRLLSDRLGMYTIRENHRPEWLSTRNGGRLELDFYIEEPQVAIEIQGAQHFTYSPFFHKDYQDYTDQLHRDRIKQQACQEMDIRLYAIDTYEEAEEIVNRLVITSPFAPTPKKQKSHPVSAKYNATIRKHLRRIRGLIYKMQRRGCVLEKDIYSLGGHLHAMQQHQQAKQKIIFDREDRQLIEVVSRFVEESVAADLVPT